MISAQLCARVREGCYRLPLTIYVTRSLSYIWLVVAGAGWSKNIYLLFYASIMMHVNERSGDLQNGVLRAPRASKKVFRGYIGLS